MCFIHVLKNVPHFLITSMCTHIFLALSTKMCLPLTFTAAGPNEVYLLLELHSWYTGLNHPLLLETKWLDYVTLLLNSVCRLLLSPHLPQQHNTSVSIRLVKCDVMILE